MPQAQQCLELESRHCDLHFDGGSGNLFSLRRAFERNGGQFVTFDSVGGNLDDSLRCTNGMHPPPITHHCSATKQYISRGHTEESALIFIISRKVLLAIAISIRVASKLDYGGVCAEC